MTDPNPAIPAGRLSLLDIKPEELIEALSNPQKADELMKQRNLSREDLLKRADLLSKELAASIAAVNVV